MTTRILLLCTGNSARSQTAEAFLRKYGGDQFKSHSAGLDPKGMNPFTIKVMEEIGLDVSNQNQKVWMNTGASCYSNISSPSAMMRTEIAPPPGQEYPIACTGLLKTRQHSKVRTK